jgi:hypothetical protein
MTYLAQRYKDIHGHLGNAGVYVLPPMSLKVYRPKVSKLTIVARAA